MTGFKGLLAAALKWLALLLIRGYQRWLSPYKGYSCAYRVYTGSHEGCSGYGLRVIRRYGVFTGYGLLQRRMQRCAKAAWRVRKQQQLQRMMAASMRTQTGHCDLPVPDCDVGDVLDCIPDSCPGCGSSRDSKPKRKRKT